MSDNKWWDKINRIICAGDVASQEGNDKLAIELWQNAKKVADAEINKRIKEIKK